MDKDGSGKIRVEEVTSTLRNSAKFKELLSMMEFPGNPMSFVVRHGGNEECAEVKQQQHNVDTWLLLLVRLCATGRRADLYGQRNGLWRH